MGIGMPSSQSRIERMCASFVRNHAVELLHIVETGLHGQSEQVAGRAR